jgi:hypothetical protein
VRDAPGYRWPRGNDGAQLPPHHLVKLVRLDFLGRQTTVNGGRGELLCLGHFQIKPGTNGWRRAVGRPPVGHDHPAETPLSPKRLVEQPRMLAGVDAVDPVVGAHDSPYPALLYRGLERRQIDLVQGAAIQLRADIHAIRLLVVHGEVLDRGHHPLILHPSDIRDRHARGEFGILAKIFEVATTERRARDVDRRSQYHVLPMPLGLAGDGRTDPLDQRGIKGCGQQGAGRERGRGPKPNPHRAIGHAQSRDMQTRHPDRVEPCARNQGDLLVEGHGRKPGIDLSILGGWASLHLRRGA